MRNIKFSLFVLIAFFSCTDDLPKEVHQNDDNKKFTKSVGDGLYDCLGYGYDCLYSNFTDPKYATKAVIDLSKIEMGVGIDQITKVEIKFQPSSIEKSILPAIKTLFTFFKIFCETRLPIAIRIVVLEIPVIRLSFRVETRQSPVW